MSPNIKITKFATLRVILLSVVALSVFDLNAILDVALDHLSLAISLVWVGTSFVLISVMTMIHPKHCIKTDPQEIAIFLSNAYKFTGYGIAALGIGISVLLAANAQYFYALVLLTNTSAILAWPSYVKKVDDESKEYMMQKLRSSA
jgi:hypothetical protein